MNCQVLEILKAPLLSSLLLPYRSVTSPLISFQTMILALFFFSSIFCNPSTAAFTLVMPDSVPSSTLVDAPQTGFTMNMDKAHTDPHEQEAVYKIMEATGNGWATSIPDICRGRWHGIECMPDQNKVYHVVALSFGSLSDDTAFPTCDQRRSSISPFITKLPHIRRLFFYQCCTHNPQPIPSFLSLLSPSLESLVLRENGHVGTIPHELGNLTSLRVLDLHNNNLGSSFPSSLGLLTRLRLLDLSKNRLSGKIPDSVSGLKAMNVLDLNQNLLQGPIPSTLGDCSSLVKIDISRNRLSGPIPDSLEKLKSLLLLDLSYNQLSGPIPLSMGNLGSLEALILKGNRMVGSMIPENLGKLQNLMILVLSSMGLEGPLPGSLGGLKSLRVLLLDGNKLNGSIPWSFRGLVNLGEVRMNDNGLTGPVPFTKEMVWRMGRKLHVYNNSGLCYVRDDGAPQQQDLDSSQSSSLMGIGYCEWRTTGHLSNSNQQQHASFPKQYLIPKSSSISSLHSSTLILNLVLSLLCKSLTDMMLH